MRYIIYNRVSTVKQLTENQRAACLEKYHELKQEGDKLYEFDEEHCTTRRPIDKRPKLKEMLGFLKKGDSLIVFKVDRLARHPQELLNLWFDLKKMGITIISLWDGLIDDQFICAHALVASLQRKGASDNTRSTLRQKKIKGERYGNIPFGYKLDLDSIQDRNEYVPSYGKPYKLIQDEKEQEAIRLMVELYNQGLSYGHIEKVLAESGYRTRTDKVIGKAQVYRILQRMPDETPIPQEMALSHG
jgi:DNA invertase Pin-like site-specific DNA recombinase